MRKIISFLLVVFLFFSMNVSAFAMNPESGVVPYAHDMEYTLELVGSETKELYDFGAAGNQDADGGWFLPAGSYLYWSETGDTGSFSLSFAYGLFSVSVDLGEVNTGSVGVSVPALAETECWIHVYKDVTIYKYKVYERLMGTSTWHFTGDYSYRVEYGRTRVEAKPYWEARN